MHTVYVHGCVCACLCVHMYVCVCVTHVRVCVCERVSLDMDYLIFMCVHDCWFFCSPLTVSFPKLETILSPVLSRIFDTLPRLTDAASKIVEMRTKEGNDVAVSNQLG